MKSNTNTNNCRSSDEIESPAVTNRVIDEYVDNVFDKAIKTASKIREDEDEDERN